MLINLSSLGEKLNSINAVRVAGARNEGCVWSWRRFQKKPEFLAKSLWGVLYISDIAYKSSYSYIYEYNICGLDSAPMCVMPVFSVYIVCISANSYSPKYVIPYDTRPHVLLNDLCWTSISSSVSPALCSVSWDKILQDGWMDGWMSVLEVNQHVSRQHILSIVFCTANSPPRPIENSKASLDMHH